MKPNSDPDVKSNSDSNNKSDSDPDIKSNSDPGIEANSNSITQDSNDTNINPWEVENLKEFQHYHCPQCNFTCKEECEFYSHAVETHKQARIIFYKDSNVTLNIVDIDVLPEIMGHSQQVNLDLSTVESQHVMEDYEKLAPFDMLDCHSCQDVSKNVSFNMPSRRVSHMLDDHSYQKVQEGNFKCPQCPTKQTFNTVSTFRKHLVDHENENYVRKNLDNVAKKHKETFLCSYANCGQFSKFEKLQEHLLFHVRAGNKELYNSKGMLSCDLCGWTIIKSDPIRLLKHLFYEHSEHTTTSDFMCEMCGKYFYDANDLKKHFENEHGDGSDIVCDKCGNIYKSKMELRQHMEEQHPKVDKKKMQTRCEFCNKKLVGSSMYEHIKNVHQDKSLRTCHLCDKILKSRAFLYTHYINDHPTENCPVEIDNINVFKCLYCEQIFATDKATITHMKLKHNISRSHHINDLKAAPKQDCPFCNETPKSSIDFIDHLVKEHPDKDPPYDLLNSFQYGFKCLGCGDYNVSPFNYYRHLKYNHQKIRGEVKEFMKRADPTKSYQCKFCSKKLKSSKTLKIHMLQKHPDGKQSGTKDKGKTKIPGVCPRCKKYKTNLKSHIWNSSCYAKPSKPTLY